MRIPTNVPTELVTSDGARLQKHISEHAALFSDGSIRVNTANIGTPADVYDADFAWVEYRLGVVRFFFAAESTTQHLHTCLLVKMSAEGFFHHFWENSREFHARLKERAERRSGLRDKTRDELRPETWDVEKRHALTANFDVLSHAGNEAQIDFFHLPPSGLAFWTKLEDGRGMKFSPKVRVLLTTDELFRLLEEAEKIVPVIEPLVTEQESL